MLIGVAGFSTDPGTPALVADEAQGAVQVRAGLLMDQDVVGAGADELGGVLIGVGNHEVNVQLEARNLADGLDHRDSDADIGDEVAIHDIDVQEASAGALDLGDFIA